MAVRTKTEIVLEQRFDPKACRHSLNGRDIVLHCHHFISLYTQLADDCALLDAKKLLAEVAEDAFGAALADYYTQHGIDSIADRFDIATQYYAVCGLGKMHVRCAGPDSGSVELERSHVDEGWIAKWGQRPEPVNFITQGFIGGMFAAVMGRPSRSFRVSETASIVSGAERSVFEIVAK